MNFSCCNFKTRLHGLLKAKMWFLGYIHGNANTNQKRTDSMGNKAMLFTLLRQKKFLVQV